VVFVATSGNHNIHGTARRFFQQMISPQSEFPRDRGLGNLPASADHTHAWGKMHLPILLAESARLEQPA